VELPIHRRPARAISRVTCVALIVGSIACGTGAKVLRPAPSADGARVITAEQILRSSATTAWDIIKQSGALSIKETYSGEPARLVNRRGRSSIYLPDSDTPLVVMDGAVLSDFRVLKQIPAHSIATIRILSRSQGALQYGTHVRGGVIIIITKSVSDVAKRP
jgi:outer membrane cobalamin receptor